MAKIDMNMDLSPVFRKLFSKKFLPFTLSGLVLLFAAVVLWIVFKPGGSGPVEVGEEAVLPASAVESSPSIEILPELERETTPQQDPFGNALQSKPFELLGILQTSDGAATAILSAGGTSYVLEAGDSVGNLSWTVKEIGDTYILLSNGKEEQTVTLKESLNFEEP